MSSVAPPARIPLLLRLALSLVEKRLGKKLLANRILAWYPKAMIGSGIMESLIAHDDREVPLRLLTLIRVATSFLVSCPFCIDMNSRDYDRKGISDQEVRVLQGRVPREEAESLSAAEKVALAYVDCICRTPLAFPRSVIDDLRRHFSDRATVIIAGTCAQVNFWARLLQGLGAPPAGFSSSCDILDLDFFSTAR